MPTREDERHEGMDGYRRFRGPAPREEPVTRSFALSQPDEVEFTFEWYESLLTELRDHGYDAVSFGDGFGDGTMALRHDVDLSPRKAMAMGRIEADLGLSATYFFLVTSPLYNVLDGPNRHILEGLVDLGHRVGLHFNTHQYWRSEPKPDALRTRIEENKAVLSVAAPTITSTVSFHCPPEWALDRKFPRVDHTYEPRCFSEIAYCADSGQRWRDQGVLDEPLPDRLQLLTHPGLWGPTDDQYIQRVTSELQTTLDRTERYVARELLHDRFDVVDYPSADISQWMPSGRLPVIQPDQ